MVIPGFAAILLAGCRRLDAVAYSPLVTPEQFLQHAPWIRIHIASLHFIFCQPTSTFIVYFVGLYALYAGYRSLSGTADRYRIYMGIGLCLTGAGALCAGTSYQALGYELKCAGRDTCTWTSWCEVIYMLLSMPGMSAFLIAGAYAAARGRLRTAIICYACISAVLYEALLIYGAMVPLRFVVSFDLFVLISLPSLLILLFLYARACSMERSSKHLYRRNVWIIFTAVSVAYYVYMLSGAAEMLWQRGVWVSENDVLHCGMIFWVYYIISKMPKE